MSGNMIQDRALAEVTEQVDRNLQRVYQELEREQIPDVFARLLEALRQKSAVNKDAGLGGSQ